MAAAGEIAVPFALSLFLLYLEPLLLASAFAWTTLRPFQFLYATHAASTISLLSPLTSPAPASAVGGATSLWSKLSTYYRTGSLVGSYNNAAVSGAASAVGSTSGAAARAAALAVGQSEFALASLPGGVAIATTVAQLGAALLGFAVAEALVLRAVYPLRSSRDLAVWKALSLAFLVAELAHLASLRFQSGDHPLDLYVRFWNWSAATAANVAPAYFGILVRLCVLLEIGFQPATASSKVALAAADKKSKSK